MEILLQQIQPQTLLIVAVVVVLILMITSLLSEFKKKGKSELVVKELLECINCKYSIESEYEPGDFVSMVKGKCPQCNKGVLKVKAIYSVEKTFHENI